MQESQQWSVLEQRDYQQAQRHFQQVTRLAPEWAPGWKALGVTLALQNDIDAGRAPMAQSLRTLSL